MKPGTLTPNHILIIQLNRLGDIIQTKMACDEVLKQHSNIEFSIVTRKSFSSPLIPILKKSFKNIFEISTDDLNGQKNQLDLDEIVNKTKDIVKEINASNPTICINHSFCRPSEYLMTLLNSRGHLGYYRSLDGNLIIFNNLAKYTFASVQSSTLNPINLVDIFKGMISIEAPSNISYKLNKKSKSIVIHPFASSAKKRFSAQKWSTIINKTLSALPQLKVFIIGSKSDLSESEKLIKKINPKFLKSIENCCGSHSIDDLEKIYRQSFLFLGHDSLGGHLAALYQTRSVTLSVGEVRPHETTPYIDDAINISPKISCFPCQHQEKCSHLECHSYFPDQLVPEIINEVYNTKNISSKELLGRIGKESCSHLEFWYGQFNKHFQLKQFNPSNTSTRALFLQVYQIMWNSLLLNNDITVEHMKLSKGTNDDIRSYLKGIEKLYELSEFGKTYSQFLVRDINNNVSTHLKSYNNSLSEIEIYLENFIESFPYFSPLVKYYLTCLRTNEGKNLSDMATACHNTYFEFSLAIKVLFELLNNTQMKEISRTSIIENN